jgi:hypothetical protein
MIVVLRIFDWQITYNKVKNKKNHVNIVFIVQRIIITVKASKEYNKYKKLEYTNNNVFVSKLVLLNVIYTFVIFYNRLFEYSQRKRSCRTRKKIGKRIKK